LDVLPSTREIKRSKDDPTKIECPVCSGPIGLEETQCPHCGADLRTADINELADLADEIKKDGQ
jgi:endogenous inhibitor of DNA gyrase (YacG/DUF329 family)